MRWNQLESYAPARIGPVDRTSKWNDGRVELLKKLWSDGLSASQIAGRLGGVTRNAVIGKVHRLGLSGRATTSRMKSHEPRLRRPRQRPPNRARYLSNATIAERAALSALAQDRQTAQAGPDLVIPPEQRLSLLDCEDDNCKWPFGDGPFYFHKCKRLPGLPYCEFHAQRAFAPTQPRKYLPSGLAAGRLRFVDGAKVLAEFDAMERA